MKIIVEVDTRNPQSAEEIRREAQYLLYVAANLDTFLAGAAAAGATVAAEQIAVTTLPPAGSVQVPPPPPSVPEAPAAAGAAQVPPPPPPATAAPSVDNTGLPWDERIHSSTKAINADGTWKKRRGVTPPIVAKVEAELRGGVVHMGAAAPQVPPPPPAAATDAAQVPPPPPAVPSAPAAAPAAPPSPLTLLQRLATAVGAGKLTVEDVIGECAKYGCANMGELAGNALAAAGVEAAFTKSGAI